MFLDWAFFVSNFLDRTDADRKVRLVWKRLRGILNGLCVFAVRLVQFDLLLQAGVDCAMGMSPVVHPDGLHPIMPVGNDKLAQQQPYGKPMTTRNV